MDHGPPTSYERMKIGPWEASLDLYAVLGVPKTATRQQIRAAYRRRIFDSHPDARRPSERPFAETRAKRLNLAASVLLDPAARARYDALRLRRGSRGQPAPAASAGSSYRREPRETDFWPFMHPSPAPPSPFADLVPPGRPPPIRGLHATLLLAASFVLGFSMLAWLAAPLEPIGPEMRKEMISGSSASPTPSHRSAS
jgi:curved DNA-binding protein CbpA